MDSLSLKRFSIFNNKPVVHANSTRVGGFSNPPFNSLNLGLHTTDDPTAVKKNRDLFFSKVAAQKNSLVFPQQIHSDTIRIVNDPGVIPETDALITGKKGLALTIQTADCFPVFIYEQKKNVCAIVHAGWRGTAKKIVLKTIKIIKVKFGGNPGDMFIGIGAGIQQKNYQVDDITANNFHRIFLLPDGDSHYKLDIQGAILQQIRECGVPDNQVEADPTCTFEAEELYYSYRRDGRNSGRMMGIIILQ